MAISSPISSAANKIVSTNRSSGSVQQVQNNYSGFLRFMEVETGNLQSIKFNKKKLNNALSANVTTTFGSAGGLLGGLMGGGLDLGGFIGDFFGKKKGSKGRGAAGKAALQEAEESAAKATIKQGSKIRLPGMKGMGVLSALFAGVDFSQRLGEGQTATQAGAGAGASAVAGLAGMAAGEALAGMIGQVLVPVPGLGFVLGAAVGGLAGAGAGYLADRMTGVNKGNQKPELKQKTEVRLKQQEQKQKAQAAAPKVTFAEVVIKFENVVTSFGYMVQRGFFGAAAAGAVAGVSPVSGDTEDSYETSEVDSAGNTNQNDGQLGDYNVSGGDLPSSKRGSLFGMRGKRMHRGIDYLVSAGTPISVVQSGTVSVADFNADPGGWGALVEVQHEDGSTTRYAHLSKITVAPGQKIKAGTMIGLSGGKPGAPGAGNSRGEHLHFEYLPKGSKTPTDPASGNNDDKFFRFGGNIKVKPKVTTQTPAAGNTPIQQETGQPQQPTPIPSPQSKVVPTKPGQQQLPLGSPDESLTPQSQIQNIDQISAVMQMIAVPQNIMNVQHISQYPSYNIGQSSITLIPITQNTSGQSPMVYSSPSGGTQMVVMPGPSEGQVLNSLFKSILLTSLSAT